MTDLAALGGLFVVSFVSATLLPAQSEAALVALLLIGDQPAAALVAAASVGNVLGSCVNWALGRGLARYQDKAWFPLSPDRLERAAAWYRRWGKYSLLASWVPVIGDPITLAAGVLREPFPVFLLLVAIAKTGRYVLLALGASGWM